jgi:hypothetical protein
VSSFSYKASIIFLFFYLGLAAILKAQNIGTPDTLPPDILPKQGLSLTVELADTIPRDFFGILDSLGINSYTLRLITRFEKIPENVILEALDEANKQLDYSRVNAFIVARAIQLLCNQDSLWKSFFSDIEMQIREPNVLRFDFRDNQKWKSYALNELFYSTFFQELLLSMGNIGIKYSRDGRQWLAGWPDQLRWKYREYTFEYMPEDMKIKVIDLSKRGGKANQESATLRLTPTKPILPKEPGDSVEPPYNIPRN